LEGSLVTFCVDFILLLSLPIIQEFDKIYGTEGKSFVSANLPIEEVPTEDVKQLDRALASVDLAEIDKLMKAGKWLTSLLVAVENLPVCVSLASADKNRPGFPLIYVNKYFERITGFSRSEIVGQNCRFLQGGKSEQDSIDRLSYSLKNAKPVKVAITNFRKDGMPFKNLLTMKPVMDENGKYCYVIGVQFDVTQDEATPAKLKLADEVMRLLPNVLLSTEKGLDAI
jgi:PAS domain S-box-containing protein